jgi:hypothetical protein
MVWDKRGITPEGVLLNKGYFNDGKSLASDIVVGPGFGHSFATTDA